VVGCCDIWFNTLIPLPGFYSLFSVTEEPMVTSGGLHSFIYTWYDRSNKLTDQWMAFYWKDKKDQVSRPCLRLFSDFNAEM
jgi:hypothetical protein